MRRSRLLAMILGLFLVFSVGGVLADPDPSPPSGAVTGTTAPGAEATPPAATDPSPTAESSPEGTPSDGPKTDEGEGAEEEVTWTKLFSELGKVIQDFRTVGILAGFIALINLLLLGLRFKPLDAWLEKKGWKKWKPLVGGILGGVLVTLVSLAKGVPLVDSLIAGAAGVLTALASCGVHNLFTSGNSK